MQTNQRIKFVHYESQCKHKIVLYIYIYIYVYVYVYIVGFK
jgi:hypothetical protein